MSASSDRNKREAMGNWKTRIRRKMGKGSRTAGSTKGENCQATPAERTFAKRSRAYKMKGYDQWLKRTRVSVA